MAILHVCLTVLLSMALLWGEHYTPWERIFGKPLHPTGNYTLGILAIILPLSGLYASWILDPPGQAIEMVAGWALAALWLDVIFSGATVYGLYLIDHAKTTEQRARLAEEEAEVWRNGAAQ